ncbi:MAG: hypothetical protein IPG45_38680 [Deltaproteobacteria bacterium]|nr:hypothetical protein [Deltaproteobacteria bacterium]
MKTPSILYLLVSVALMAWYLSFSSRGAIFGGTDGRPGLGGSGGGGGGGVFFWGTGYRGGK